MPRELEAKVRVESHDAVREALKIAAAVRLGASEQLNRFFDTPGRDLRSGGCGLRIRTASNGSSLTYKGPLQSGPYKSREELETEIADPGAMEGILRSLGFQMTFAFEKHRESWSLGNCQVELDDVPGLGLFVEVEGPDEKAIRAVLSQLGLGDRESLRAGYAELLSTVVPKPL